MIVIKAYIFLSWLRCMPKHACMASQSITKEGGSSFMGRYPILWRVDLNFVTCRVHQCWMSMTFDDNYYYSDCWSVQTSRFEVNFAVYHSAVEGEGLDFFILETLRLSLTHKICAFDNVMINSQSKARTQFNAYDDCMMYISVAESPTHRKRCLCWVN